LKKGLTLLMIIATVIILSVSLNGCGTPTVNKNFVMDEPAPSGASDAREIKLDFTSETITKQVPSP